MPNATLFQAQPVSTSTPAAAPAKLNINNLPPGYSIAGSGQSNPKLNINSLPSGYSIAGSPDAQKASQGSQSNAETINENYGSGKINAADVVIQDVGEAAKQTNEALTSNWSPVGWGNSLFQGAVGALSSGIKKVVDPIANKIGGALRNKVGAQTADTIGQKTLGNKTVQAVNSRLTDASTAGDIGAVGNVLGLTGTVTGAAGVAESAGDLASSKAGTAISDSLKQKAIDSSKADWTKPTTVSKPAYNNAKDIFNVAAKNGHDIPTTIVNNGIKLSDNVEGGNYATQDTAAKMRTDAGKASADLLRPSLEKADSSPNAPKTPVSDIVKASLEDIKKSKGVTADDVEARTAKAQAKGAALARKYPNGMSLTDMHDEKINYANNGKYSPFGDTNINNNAEVNRSFGRTLGDSVEKKAPANIPVKQFNAELQKQYQAADYLDSLDTKKVPVSMMSRIAKTAAKVAGAGVGDALGGGILGGVGGYHVGGMVESMLEGMPNPIKAHFLDNLQTTNPEAFQALRSYLKSPAPSLLGLPGGSYPGGSAATAVAPNTSPSTPQFFSGPDIPLKGETSQAERSGMDSQAPGGPEQGNIPKPSSIRPEVTTPEMKTQIQNDVMQRLMKFRTKEGFLNAVKNNPYLTEDISKAGWTPEMAWQKALSQFQKMGALNPLSKGKSTYPIPDPTLFGKKK